MRIRLPLNPKVGQRLSNHGDKVYHKPLHFVAIKEDILVTYIEGGTYYQDRYEGNYYEPAKFLLFIERPDSETEGFKEYEFFLEFPSSIKRYFEE